MDRGWRVEPDPGMAVLVVVVGEEQVAECACVVQGGEGAREDGAVLEGLECRLGEWVVVGDVRPGMAAGDVQVSEQGGDVLGGHRGAVIGVDVARLRAAVSDDGVLHERFRQVAALAVMNLPADDLAGDARCPLLSVPAGTRLRHSRSPSDSREEMPLAASIVITALMSAGLARAVLSSRRRCRAYCSSSFSCRGSGDRSARSQPSRGAWHWRANCAGSGQPCRLQRRSWFQQNGDPGCAHTSQ